jgi:actin
MNDIPVNYSSVVIDCGSGIIKAGFGGEDGPRSIFSSVVGIPKMPGLLVGMEQKERYVGEEAIAKMDIMNFSSPIKKGEIVDWNKFETLLHHIFYDELKVVPEEISILITESPLNKKENRAKLAETLFETFNVEKLHIANSAMLGLYSYGKTNGIVLDSGYSLTTCVPVYEGYPLPHASIKLNVGGEDLSEALLSMIYHNINPSYKGIKGRLLADDIKEKLGYIALNSEDEEKFYFENVDGEKLYTLPDNKKIRIGRELFKHSEVLFKPEDNNHTSIPQLIVDSLSKCDSDIINDVKESICLIGGTTLFRGFTERLKNELARSLNSNSFNLIYTPERQFSSWIGGSIISSLNNFNYMWVTKQEYDEIGNALEAIDSKCF